MRKQLAKIAILLTLLYAVAFGTVDGDDWDCTCSYYFIDPKDGKEQSLKEMNDEVYYDPTKNKPYNGEAICENYCEGSFGKMKDGKPYGKWKEFKGDERIKKIAKDKANAIAKVLATVKKSSFIDSRDNKTYKIVKIGSQTWFAENLNYDAKDSKCYEDIPANCGKYGRLYNWETAKKVCPAGWHLPTEAEWEVLTAIAGGKIADWYLKSVNGWESGKGDDAFGFSALPGGSYSSYSDDNGASFNTDFHNVGNGGLWWSATEAKDSYVYYRYMYSSTNLSSTFGDKTNLYSVRCVKD